MSSLVLRGAREHNLRAIDLDLPHGHWIAVVGPSGSGKTSLVFSTLVREGQRRYLGTLSARARHFLGKLGRADVDVIAGLPPTIAVGQHALTSHARSTVGTLTGCLDLLRLLFARQAHDPEGVALTRAHFSFNQADGACPVCRGLGVEDRVDPDLLVADPSKTLREGALRPTLKNGYTVYSQVTLEVMDQLCQAHGFDVNTPWCSLSDAQRDMVLYGSKARKVPFGKHGIASRMRWEGITARPREEGYYRGLIPVIEQTLKRSRNPNILRFVRSVPCSVCAGSRLARPGRQARLGPFALPELLALPVRALESALSRLPDSPVWRAIAPSLGARTERLLRLGLGHLALDRPSTTLSGGEAQRVRLAAQLFTGLGGLLLALDEPTLGLHPDSQAGMASVLDDLRQLGNTLLVVEHDPDMVRYADHLVQLGPGAGPDGGTVLFDGPLSDISKSAKQSPRDPLGPPPTSRVHRRLGNSTLSLSGATLHNLQGVRLNLHLATFTVVSGPSGAGKSSLVFGTLLPALRGEPGGPFTSLDGVLPGLSVQAVDARPIGRTPRSTPATWSGLFDDIRKRFASTAQARERGFTASSFSYNNQAGRCAHCQGLGSLRIGLHLLEDIEQTCPVCHGGRYGSQVLDVRLRGCNIAEVLAMTVRDALAFFVDDPPLLAQCQAMEDLGLGYLSLGQSSTSLSRGEAQRIKLATLVAKAATSAKSAGGPSVLLMDEPDRGLHPDDVGRLLRAIGTLVDAGHTVLAISHHRHLWAAADYRVRMAEGRIVVDQSATSERHQPVARTMRGPGRLPAEIHLAGVCTHNLDHVELRLPHRAISVVVGPSGSGKSALAFDSLAAEAWARFSESLPFQVRRFMRRLPRPPIATAEGLTAVVALRQTRGGRRSRVGARSTVASLSELGPLLRVLWSRLGIPDARASGLSAAHFSPDQALGACPECAGMGTVPRCSPERLLSDPQRSLLDGAMQGTRPGRFFGEPDGQYLATLQAVLGEDVDLHRPWCELPRSARAIALHGAGDRIVEVSWRYQRGKRLGVHHFQGTWDGLCALVEREARVRAGRKNAAEWAAPLVQTPCAACQGQRLGVQARAVEFGGRNLPALWALPLSQVGPALLSAPLSADRQAVFSAIWSELAGRLDDLLELGLGHLSLDRPSDTLSSGELQRVRLASVLRSGLTGITLVLDEPSAGLHRRELRGLLTRLHRIRDDGNTVVIVDHRPELIRAAEHIVELGPGAGAEGGRIVAQGSTAQVLAGEGLTALALRSPPVRRVPVVAPRTLRVFGASLHNLKELDIALPRAGFVAVLGVSGSGKTSLVFGVIDASAQAGRPIGCAKIEGLEHYGELRSASSIASTPLDAMKLLAPVQALFHAAAHGSGLPRRAFSFRSPAGRCPTCLGSGQERIAMDFLAELALPCPACQGRRYLPEVLAVRWRGMDIASFLERPLASLCPLLEPGALLRGVQALVRVGLGHIGLGRASRTLSGGEAQRILLARSLVLPNRPGTGRPILHLLDEPGKGLHEHDLADLVSVFDELAARGDLVIATSHRSSLVHAADWIVELGPEGGPAGGRVIYQGTPPR